MLHFCFGLGRRRTGQSDFFVYERRERDKIRNSVLNGKCMPIKFTKYGIPQIAAAGGIAAAASGLILLFLSGWWLWLIAAPALLFGFVLFFFRDPRRTIPTEKGLLVSPADGYVTDITTCAEDEFIGEEARRISIFLTVADVHLNRAPLAGAIERIVYRKGRFVNAMRRSSADVNERNDVLIRSDENGEKFLVRQIAGVIARRIVCARAEGDSLERGEIFGMIKFGSRTDVFFPARLGFEPCVKVGRHIKAGQTVLGKFV